MKDKQVKIENIVDLPEHIDIVAKWIYNEFVKHIADRTFDFVVERFKGRNTDKAPMSLIALIDNTCIGVVSFFDNDLTTKPDLTPWLAGLYVKDEYRKNGVAEKLINELLDVARKIGYSKIYLRTEHVAQYYQKRGWTFIEDTVDEYNQKTSILYKEL